MTIQQLIQELLLERKKPILVLILSEVSRKEVRKACKLLNQKHYEELDIILHTPGGEIEPAFQYAKLFRRVADKVNVLVPYYSKSAGTLMCLSADSIVMTDLSELGPLDTQIREEQDGNAPGYTSALNGFKALEQIQKHSVETLDLATKMIALRSQLKMSEVVHLANEFTGNTCGTLYSQLNPKKIAEYARALEIGERYAIMILTRYMGWTEANAIAVVDHLVKGYPSHGFIIDQEELSTILGLPAEKAQGATEQILTKMRDLLSKSIPTTVELHEPVTQNITGQPGQEQEIKGSQIEIADADDGTEFEEVDETNAHIRNR